MRFRVFREVLSSQRLGSADPGAATLLILNELALNHDDCLWMMIRTMNTSLNLSAQNFVHLEDIALLLPSSSHVSHIVLPASVSVDGVTGVPLHRTHVRINVRIILQ